MAHQPTEDARAALDAAHVAVSAIVAHGGRHREDAARLRAVTLPGARAVLVSVLPAIRTQIGGSLELERRRTTASAMSIAHTIAAAIGWDLDVMAPGPSFVRYATGEGYADARACGAFLAAAAAIGAVFDALRARDAGNATSAQTEDQRVICAAYAAAVKVASVTE